MIRQARLTFGPAAWAAVLLAVAFCPAGRAAFRPQSLPAFDLGRTPGPAPGPAGPPATVSEYVVRARAFLLGDLGPVGTAVFERRLERTESGVVKTVRFSGRSSPEQVRKGRDIGGELVAVTCSPADVSGEPSADSSRGPADTCSWELASNRVPKRERITFYPDHALSLKDGKPPNRFAGRFESLLAWLEFFVENSFRPGEVHRSRFILDGRPYLFRCDVIRPEVLEPYGLEAWRIDLTMLDPQRRDGSGNPGVVKKKGAIRLWLCRDGEHRNEFLRLQVQYKWYLTLVFDLVPGPGRRLSGREISS